MSAGASTSPGAGVSTRRATVVDAVAMVAIHFAAVHKLGAESYPPAVLEAWSPPSGTRRLSSLSDAIASDHEVLLVAEMEGTVVGWGALHPAQGELRAIYVHPSHARRGMGALLLRQLEGHASNMGLKKLQLNASMNAEPFYKSQGYERVSIGLHKLNDELSMTCVTMNKSFA